jgi:threonine/homoserine/homoserine lactone efflux protein
LIFFGAFIPQFIDPSGNYFQQVLIMGATAIVVAAISDGMYAILVGSAGRRITERQVKWLSRTSGGVLIGGGIWLAMTRAR